MSILWNQNQVLKASNLTMHSTLVKGWKQNKHASTTVAKGLVADIIKRNQTMQFYIDEWWKTESNINKADGTICKGVEAPLKRSQVMQRSIWHATILATTQYWTFFRIKFLEVMVAVSLIWTIVEDTEYAMKDPLETDHPSLKTT